LLNEPNMPGKSARSIGNSRGGDGGEKKNEKNLYRKREALGENPGPKGG